MAGIKGGDKLIRRLNDIAQRAEPASVKIGFLQDARYPDGKSIAYVAAINEFGAVINREAGETTVYRKVNAARTGFLRGGRFVKKRISNFATTHQTPAYQIRIPPRPFFRGMIKANASGWPAQLAKALKGTRYDTARALGRMGELIKGQLVASIKAFTDPPNAPSTIQKKGFDKPLIDTGAMWASVDYEVTMGAQPTERTAL